MGKEEWLPGHLHHEGEGEVGDFEVRGMALAVQEVLTSEEDEKIALQNAVCHPT